jgi:multisubunit Na+/H+ antiporter MnhE subunit
MRQINVVLGNIFLSLVWMALTGAFTFANFVVGFAVSSAVLWLTGSRGEVAFIVYLIFGLSDFSFSFSGSC